MLALRHIVSVLLLGIVPAGAAESLWQSTNNYVLGQSAVRTNQLFLLAEQARLDGRAEDDLFALVQDQLTFNGEAQGDAWLMAGHVHLDGHLRDHTRAAGRTVVVAGLLDRSLLAAGSMVQLQTGSVVRGDVTLAGENVALEGTVGGRVYAVAQTVTLAGTLEDDVRVVAHDIVVMPGTLIAGDLSYTSGKELFLDRSVQLGGKLQRVMPSASATGEARFSLGAFLLRVMQAAGAFLVGLPFAALFPRAVGRAGRHVRFQPVRCMLLGSAALFALPFLALAAAFTVVGLPLGILIAGMMGAFFYLAKIVVAINLGAWLLRRRSAQSMGVTAATMAVGLVVVYSLAALPVVGSSLALLAALVGSGALWWSVLRGEYRLEAVPPPVPQPSSSVEHQ